MHGRTSALATQQTPSLVRSSILLSAPGSPALSHHAFLAGTLGGYLVWGREYSSLHYQIVLYLASRILVGCAKLCLIETNNKDNFGIKNVLRNYGYPLSASLVWGIVMVLFESYPHVLHPSLKRSMDDIYGPPAVEMKTIDPHPESAKRIVSV